MSKLSRTSRIIGWVIVETLIIIICFVLFQPKLSSLLFQYKRTQIWQNYVNQVINKSTIEPSQFWIFREYYSPGSFSYYGYQQSSYLSPLASIINLKSDFKRDLYLIFQSRKISSYEYLTSDSNISNALQNIPNQNEIIFSTTDSIIYYSSPSHDTVIICFIKPISDMANVNGYLYDDLQNRDFAQLMQDKYLLVGSKIILN